MTVSDKIALGSAIATVLGVLIAAIALWKQLAKLNQQLTLQHFADYTKRYQEIVQRFPEDINVPNLQIAGRDDYNPTMRAMRMYFDLCFEEWYLNKRKFIDPKIWEVWRGGMATAFSKSAFREAWEVVVKDTRFGSEFEQFVTGLLSSGTTA